MTERASESSRTAIGDAPLWKALTAALPGYVSCIDRQRRVLFLNKTLSRDVTSVLGQPMEGFVAPPHREAVIACVEKAFEHQEEQSLAFDALLADGQERQMVTRVFPVTSGDGTRLALMLTDDHTDRRALERELAQSLEFRRRVVEHFPDFVAMVDRAHRMVWVNRVSHTLKLEDVVGEPVDKFISPETKERALSVIDATFASGVPGHYEVEGHSYEGSENAWYQTRVAPVLTDGKIDHVLLVTSDITSRKVAERALRETEEQLHRAQRLESIGQLAGGIAHDFNNLLQVISGNLLFALDGVGRGEDIKDELEQASRATQRAAALTSHLLAIGRRKRLEVKPVNLGQLVAGSIRMLKRAIPENVELRYEEPDEAYLVELDAPQFEQVLINLCVNARDAMPEGGHLTVKVEGKEKEPVQLTVTDTGSGIAEENLPHIFEPFFSTKGAGSGLGLAVAAGIVAAHGGAIRAESDGRTGTIMKVSLPRLAGGDEVPSGSPIEAPAHGAGTILVAEDEPEVRAQAVRVLERHGYTVLQAKDGAQAVEIFHQRQGEIDLVLLDAIMPVMDGWKAYLRMATSRPGLKVLFATGYAADVLPADFHAKGGRLLSKPFTPARLLEEVGALLAQSRARGS